MQSHENYLYNNFSKKQNRKKLVKMYEICGRKHLFCHDSL